MIAINLCRQQELDSDPKAIHKINFTVNLDLNAKIFSLLKKQRKLF